MGAIRNGCIAWLCAHIEAVSKLLDVVGLGEYGEGDKFGEIIGNTLKHFGKDKVKEAIQEYGLCKSEAEDCIKDANASVATAAGWLIWNICTSIEGGVRPAGTCSRMTTSDAECYACCQKLESYQIGKCQGWCDATSF
jgi:hypothetical protein